MANTRPVSSGRGGRVCRLFLAAAPAFVLALSFLPGAVPAQTPLPQVTMAADNSASSAGLTAEAERIYRDFGAAVFQIQVIDIASGKKSSIGSGFRFAPEGYFATNYHVVADAMLHPEQNRVEFLGADGVTGALRVVAADVVHDLALLQREEEGADGKEEKKTQTGMAALQLSTRDLARGASLFSLGNPHDIGFTIVEGTYNGLIENSLYEKIHFSGALNPGMSGGPALDMQGRVVGVNVATAGNQIGFLVPVRYLARLQAEARVSSATDLAADLASENSVEEKSVPENSAKTAKDAIGSQLEKNQSRYVADILAAEWESVPFGPFRVPGKIHNVFKCWGGVGHKQDDPYEIYRTACSTEDEIYIEEDFTTGAVYYRYDHLRAGEDMGASRFYSFYEQRYATPLSVYENATDEAQVTNFSCTAGFVDLAGGRWKTSYCARHYKNFPGLFDVHLYMALVGRAEEGFLLSLALQGVGTKQATDLVRRFFQEIRPK